MTIKLTAEESEDYFLNAICNGLGYVYGYGLDLQYNPQDYEAAKKKLTSPCFEDVLMQILRDGNSLTMVDEEGDGENTKSITLQDVHEKVELTPIKHLTDMITENDDAETADVIIQTVFFGELIFA